MQKSSLWLAATILILLITACGVDQTAAQEPTPDPSVLTIYTIEAAEVHERYLPAFQREHPDIKLNVVSALTGDLTEKLLLEKNDPQADVVYVLAATSLLRAAAEGILEPYAPAGLDRVNPRMRDRNDPPLFVGIDVFMSAFCVNTVELEKRGLPMPTSWQDLTSPIYRDQIVMPDPGTSAIGYIAVSAFLQLFGPERGWAYMDRLHQNIALYTRAGSAPCTLAAEARVPIGISFGAEATRRKAEGFPIEPVFPVEGSGWEVEANALVRKPVIKPEAKIFLDWAISDSAMREYAQGFPVTSVPVDLPLPDGYTTEPFDQLIANSFPWATANRDRITEEWINRYGQKSEARGTEIPDAFQ
jgi:iron(III) transport system substrate-binding protein